MPRLWQRSLQLVVALLITLPGFAQTFRGTLSGTVTDSQGAVIPTCDQHKNAVLAKKQRRRRPIMMTFQPCIADDTYALQQHDFFSDL